jgi:hypothetical protein
MVTQIELYELKAYQRKEGILIKWQTGYEVNNLGFHVYREENGQLYRLTPELIAGTALLGGSGTFLTGRDYSWWDLFALDTRPSTHATLSYWLEDIDLNGKATMHGPVEIQTSVISNQLSDKEILSSELLGERGRRLQEKYEEFWRIEELKEKLSLKRLEAEGAGTSSPRGALTLEANASNLKPLGAAPQGNLVSDPQSSAMQRSLAGTRDVKIYVREEGWYRITQPELMAAGLSPRVNPRNLRLFAEGREIPMRVIGEQDGRFDPKDAIEFYGVGLDTLSTDTRVYWLTGGLRAGKRIQTVEGPEGSMAGDSFLMTEEKKERWWYFPALRNGEESNLFGAMVIFNSSVNQLLTLGHLDPSPPGNAILEVRLQGVTVALHRVKVS